MWLGTYFCCFICFRCFFFLFSIAIMYMCVYTIKMSCLPITYIKITALLHAVPKCFQAVVKEKIVWITELCRVICWNTIICTQSPLIEQSFTALGDMTEGLLYCILLSELFYSYSLHLWHPSQLCFLVR